jgi:hypothetical protein
MKRHCLLAAALVAGVAAAQEPQAADGPPVRSPISLGLTGGVEHFEDPGYPVPGFHVVSQSRRDLWLPGFITLGAGYLLPLGFTIRGMRGDT